MTDDLSNKKVMVTGACTGLGRILSVHLAKAGADLVMLCSDHDQGEKERDSIAFWTGNRNIECHEVDFASQDSIRSFAQRFAREHDELHVLINAHSMVSRTRLLTPDGVEQTLAVNYLSHFLLTNLLVPLLQRGAPSRIVNVSSGLHAQGRIDFDDLSSMTRFDSMEAYTQSKLAMVLFTYELADRLEDTGITVNCLAPPYVVKDREKHESLYGRLLMSLLGPRTDRSEHASDTAIFLARSPEVSRLTGRFFVDRHLERSSTESYDHLLGESLWRERMVGLA